MKLITDSETITTLTRHLVKNYADATYTHTTVEAIQKDIEDCLVEDAIDKEGSIFVIEVPQPRSYSHQFDQTFYLKENEKRRIAVTYRFKPNFGNDFLRIQNLTQIQVL